MNPSSRLGFEVLTADLGTAARRGRLLTRRGEVETPVFMPVGTAGTVKGILPWMLRDTGARIILGNTYHLYLRPGLEVVEKLGGLHRMMAWDGPILTDSGGYQVFSQAGLRKIAENGVRFRSHIDGSQHELTPEKAIAIQETLGSDIMMVLDECPPAGADPRYVAASVERTTRWAERCLAARTSSAALFGILQGGTVPELRAAHAEVLTRMSFDGFAIGGLSVGEGAEEMVAITRLSAALLPPDRPRYLMGVGRPSDILQAVACGVDMFDCVLPTRGGRMGTLFTSRGELIIKHARYRLDERPPDSGCPCPVCARFSRAYLRHLFLAGEMLGAVLNTLHNLCFFGRLMEEIRASIPAGTFPSLLEERLPLLDRRVPGGE
ncbi:MAG: tRNA guanosine(34) transglycosylase Tgt [Deltaproteobacteria bacterium]|nr:tRNA guanosine(34) transglycosylase Tgt [Deltaproteobacteria bacterium]